MEAIVLAGGFGTRLRQAVPDLPKPMAPIASRPFLEILLSVLAKKGITRVVLSLGYMSDKIISHLGNYYSGMNLDYEIESHPLGTGGAIRAAMMHCSEDHVFVFNGDTYLDIELEELECLWNSTHQPVVVVREVEDTSRFGRVEIKNNFITAFCEKGISGPGFINAGCYVLPKDALNNFVINEPFSLETDYIAKSLNDNGFKSFITRGQFIDIGVPEDYMLAQKILVDL